MKIKHYIKPYDFILLWSVLTVFLGAYIFTFGVSARSVSYSSCLILLTLWQFIFPGFLNNHSFKPARWLTNYLLAFVNLFIVGVIPLLGTFYIARIGFGLFSVIEVPNLIMVLVSLLILDLSFYWLHRAFHQNSIMWKSHQVHHNDLGYDVSLVGRDHPLTALALGLVRLGIVLILGIPTEALIAYLVLVSIFASFQHANAYLPLSLDRFIGKIFVTPRIHYPHHSSVAKQTDSNFGTIFVIWDKVFGTYTDPYITKLEDIEIGLDGYRNPTQITLLKLLKMPFKRRHVL